MFGAHVRARVRGERGGAGALVLSTGLDATGANVTRIGYGSQSLMKEDGAKFALELVEAGDNLPFSVL